MHVHFLFYCVPSIFVLILISQSQSQDEKLQFFTYLVVRPVHIIICRCYLGMEPELLPHTVVIQNPAALSEAGD